jgi:hypothetical protein
MIGMGSPPPGLEGRIQAAEHKYAELVRRLSSYRQKEDGLRAKLSALTGKEFARASAWDEWLRKEYRSAAGRDVSV